MTFAVNPEAIRRYAATLPAGVQDAQAARVYLAQYAELAGWGAENLLCELRGAHETLVGEVRKRLDRLTALLEAAKLGLDDAATRYQHTDQRSAASLDATYPYVVRGE